MKLLRNYKISRRQFHHHGDHAGRNFTMREIYNSRVPCRVRALNLLRCSILLLPFDSKHTFDVQQHTGIIIISVFSIVSVILLYLWLLSGSFTMLPVWSDEFFYYVNSANFYFNTTLRAALTYTGRGASVFGADGHGFAYPLLHGSIAKIIGWHTWNIPLTNLFFVLSAIIVIQKALRISLQRKVVTLICIAASPTAILFTFTFMQESLHLFISVCTTLLLLKIYAEKRPRDIILFCFLLAAASLFRNSWFLWSIGLLPLAKSWKHHIIFGSIFLTSAIMAYLYTVYLWDSFPSFISTVTSQLRSGRYLQFFTTIARNVYDNCISYVSISNKSDSPAPYLLSNLILLLIIAFLAYEYFIRKSTFALALLLITILNILMLFFLFNAWGFRDMRTMAPLVTAFVIYTATTHSRVYTGTLILFILLSIIPATIQSHVWIKQRNSQALNFHSAKSQQLIHREIAQACSARTQPLIYVNNTPSDFTLDLLLLPLATSTHSPIRYAVNYFREEINLCDFDYLYCSGRNAAVATSARAVLTNPHYQLFRIACTQP